MSQQASFGGFPDRARQILRLVGELADRIREEELSPGSERTERVRLAWDALRQAIIEVGPSLPLGHDHVDAWLKDVATLTRQFDELQKRGLANTFLVVSCDGFLRLAQAGQSLLAEVPPHADPFAFLDSLERSRVADLDDKTIVVTTAGDLWKALTEGKDPAVEVSSIRIEPRAGTNIMPMTHPQPADQAKWGSLDRALALCYAEGGDPCEAMQKLMARVALTKHVEMEQVINMPLAEFVAAASATVPSAPPTSSSPLASPQRDANSIRSVSSARDLSAYGGRPNQRDRDRKLLDAFNRTRQPYKDLAAQFEMSVAAVATALKRERKRRKNRSKPRF